VRVLALVVGLVLIATILWDAFETVVLPRTVTRRFRLAGVYFRGTWWPWARLARSIGRESRRERFLGVYGPLSLVVLLAMWAVALVFGFAVLFWSSGSDLQTPGGTPGHFADDVYFSGTTFFTLGLGDIHPIGAMVRVLTVAEAGMGFALLAVVISYFPVLYQSFSRREVQLTLLDAWAGSPPSAAEVLRRLADSGELAALGPFLKEWEHWCSDVLESHISYPVLAYFRSQHQRQSWVSALTTILDLSALISTGIEGVATWQAHVTFAVARHAAVDLVQVLHAAPDRGVDRLPPDRVELLRKQLEAAGLRPDRSSSSDARLRELRRSYEPFVQGLSRSLMMDLPAWWRERPGRDNWQTSPRRDRGAHF
jgi:hypothetical protein